jgi:hypothetical protein
MGKKITLAILLLLVVGGAVLQNIYIKGTTEKLIDSLKSVETALGEGDLSEASAAADEFGTEWEKEKKLFEALFEHDEVDIISASVKSLQSYCRTGARDEALACVSETIFYIEHIKEIDTLGWENIF